MRDYWHCLASFGRFVHVGLTEVMSTQELDMNVFQREATFTCFDIDHIILEKPELGARYDDNSYKLGESANMLHWSLMSIVDELHENGSIKPTPFLEIQVSDIKYALLSSEADINSPTRVVSYSKKSAIVQVSHLC